MTRPALDRGAIARNAAPQRSRRAGEPRSRRRFWFGWTLFGLWLCIALAIPVALHAQTIEEEQQSPVERLDYIDDTSAFVEKVLEDPASEPSSMDQLRETMGELRTEARALAERLSAELQPLTEQLEALGPPPEEGETEPSDVADRRADLEQKIDEVGGPLSRAESAAVRADSLLEGLAQRQRDVFTDRLFSHGESVFSAGAWQVALTEALALTTKFATGAWAAIAPIGWQVAVIALAALLGLLYYVIFRPKGLIRRIVDQIVAAVNEAPGPGLVMAYGLALFVVRVAPATLLLFLAGEALKEWGDLRAPGVMFVNRLVEGVALVLIAAALARTIFAPRTPQQRIIMVDDATAQRAVSRITLLAGVVCGGRLLLDVAESAGAQLLFLTIVNALIALAAAPLIYELARVLAPPRHVVQAGADESAQRSAEEASEPPEEGGALAAIAGVCRLAGLATAIIVPTSAALGYYALSRFILERASLTAALLVGLGLAYVIVKRMVQAMPGAEPDGAETGGSQSARPWRGLAPTLTALLLSFAAAPLMAAIWGASAADLHVLAIDLIDGVQVGEARYSILDVLRAVGVLVIGLWITRFLQRLLRRDVLPNTSLDAGLKASLTAGLGYIGFIITGLLTISAVGLDLSNVAIIAGALSVGIGFGLQNVVNNFVSGLILLIERPIKIGDWIVVAGEQGYVRRINVRSTEIETFDRASVIVPNSELISGSVTNWTHKSSHGRVIARVGVSYDSDAEKVVQILQEIGAQHQMAVRYPAPFVYFAGFGDSALDFELRLIIRDVNYTLSVHNDLNMEIYRRFKEEGIEIPFPQRDLHIRTGALANGHTGGEADQEGLLRAIAGQAASEVAEKVADQVARRVAEEMAAQAPPRRSRSARSTKKTSPPPTGERQEHVASEGGED